MSDEDNKANRDKESDTNIKREESVPPPKPEPPKLAKVHDFSENNQEIIIIKKNK